MEEINHYWVYMLTCNDGSLYTGMTKDIIIRYAQHQTKTAKCKYTRRKDKHPLRLSACWKVYGTRGDAIKVEIFIKKGTTEFKRNLVANPKKLEELFIEARDYDLKIESYDKIENMNNKVRMVIESVE